MTEVIIIPHAVQKSYDEEADVLYVSFGSPRPAEGIDMGASVIIRFDRPRNEVVGLTIMFLQYKVGEYMGVKQHKINFPQGTPIVGEYDKERDSILLSFKKQKESVDIDNGGDLVIHFNQSRSEVVGLTVRRIKYHVEEYLL